VFIDISFDVIGFIDRRMCCTTADDALYDMLYKRDRMKHNGKIARVPDRPTIEKC